MARHREHANLSRRISDRRPRARCRLASLRATVRVRLIAYCSVVRAEEDADAYTARKPTSLATTAASPVEPTTRSDELTDGGELPALKYENTQYDPPHEAYASPNAPLPACSSAPFGRVRVCTVGRRLLAVHRSRQGGAIFLANGCCDPRDSVNLPTEYPIVGAGVSTCAPFAPIR
jgi:hypothetical protein